jgi:NADH-quinone oxidoreductase subunit I
MTYIWDRTDLKYSPLSRFATNDRKNPPTRPSQEACPTYAIQLTLDFEMSEYERKNMVYEKEDLLIDGPGKYPGYNFYRVVGLAIAGKAKGEAEHEAPPVDVKSLLP